MITWMGSVFGVSYKWEGGVRIFKVPVSLFQGKMGYSEIYEQKMLNNIQDVILTANLKHLKVGRGRTAFQVRNSIGFADIESRKIFSFVYLIKF
jgi:hypothetical protein